MKSKALFIIFEELSIVRNCLRLDSGALILLFFFEKRQL